MSATSHLKDDFSCSTFQNETSSESSLSDFEDASWLVDSLKKVNDSLEQRD